MIINKMALEREANETFSQEFNAECEPFTAKNNKTKTLTLLCVCVCVRAPVHL